LAGFASGLDCVLTNSFNFLDNMDGLSSESGSLRRSFLPQSCLTGTANPIGLSPGFLLILAGSLQDFCA